MILEVAVFDATKFNEVLFIGPKYKVFAIFVRHILVSTFNFFVRSVFEPIFVTGTKQKVSLSQEDSVIL